MIRKAREQEGGKDGSTVGEPDVKPIGEVALIVDEVKVLVYMHAPATCHTQSNAIWFLINLSFL